MAAKSHNDLGGGGGAVAALLAQPRTRRGWGGPPKPFKHGHPPTQCGASLFFPRALRDGGDLRQPLPPRCGLRQMEEGDDGGGGQDAGRARARAASLLDSINSVPVQALKERARAHGLTSTGMRDELIARLQRRANVIVAASCPFSRAAVSPATRAPVESEAAGLAVRRRMRDNTEPPAATCGAPARGPQGCGHARLRRSSYALGVVPPRERA